MCDCKTELESKLKARFIEKVPEGKNHNVELGGYGFVIIDSGMVTRGYMPVTQTALMPLKKGGSKEKKYTQNMFFSFCPFCGEAFQAGKS